MRKNPYLPYKAEVVGTEVETEGERAIKTLKVRLLEEDNFEYEPGQGSLVSVFGRGESWLALANSPTRDDLEFSVLRMGRVTTALHELVEGDILGVRGPVGNKFPLNDWKKKNIITIGGGIGQTPIRSLCQYVMDNYNDYGDLTIVYGARTSGDIVYRNELMRLLEGGRADVYLSIDVEEEGWDHFVGYVPDNVKENVRPSPENSVAITCGPPVMIKFTFQALKGLGFADEQIYTTLERKMKCGIGKCGRCNIGEKYVCKDGPIFRYDELRELPVKY